MEDAVDVEELELRVMSELEDSVDLEVEDLQLEVGTLVLPRLDLELLREEEDTVDLPVLEEDLTVVTEELLLVELPTEEDLLLGTKHTKQRHHSFTFFFPFRCTLRLALISRLASPQYFVSPRLFSFSSVLTLNRKHSPPGKNYCILNLRINLDSLNNQIAGRPPLLDAFIGFPKLQLSTLIDNSRLPVSLSLSIFPQDEPANVLFDTPNLG